MTVTCSECGYQIDGASEKEIADQMRDHVNKEHPEKADQVMKKTLKEIERVAK